MDPEETVTIMVRMMTVVIQGSLDSETGLGTGWASARMFCLHGHRLSHSQNAFLRGTEKSL